MARSMIASLSLFVWTLQYTVHQTHAFTSPRMSDSATASQRTWNLKQTIHDNEGKDGNDNDEDLNTISSKSKAVQSRRYAIQSATNLITSASILATFTSTPTSANAISLNPFTPPDQISNGGKYLPGKRATAYLVDSTIPPSLVPFRASREAAILKSLGNGLGTNKAPYTEDALNLNNMMNKAVFGTIDTVKGIVGSGTGEDGEADPKKKKKFDASFVFLGVDYADANDAELAVGLMTDILKPRRGANSALALEFAPLSMQPALDSYLSSTGSGTSSADAENALVQSLAQEGQVPKSIIENQLPLLRFAKSKQLSIIACAPELSDAKSVRTGGLQSITEEQRVKYVADAEGFIAWTQDAKNRVYTDKSLMKDFAPINDKDAPGNYFAEKILTHETMATAIARYAVRHPGTLVVAVAPLKDVRYFGGANGRLARVCKYIKGDTNIDEEAVTTILLNPSAKETLSKSNFIRLEIGTRPDLLKYETKVADYLWFSSMPKVNMIPRMMNGN
jgi:hypothetical protein